MSPSPKLAEGPRRLFSESRRAIAAAFGISPAQRVAVVRAMLERHGRERASYWLQLVLAMGIATYGLVLGSTGVVIGAMLVSPLMGPLVEIGMGLVTGSAQLVLYAAWRTLASIGAVIACSAGLTLLLPYHELTSEIAARTAPTLIDLYVASFCAIAAAYTTARTSSETISAAAGTAISIALVPPLCVVGWGLGGHELAVSAGAGLLFTANFCAILFFAVAAFVVLGFDEVPVQDVGAGGGTRLDAVAGRMHRFLGARYGWILRFLMPMLFVAAVFFPLRRALGEVAWKARVRAQVEQILDASPAAKNALRSSVVVEYHAVSVRLLIIGNTEAAARLKRELGAPIAAAGAGGPSNVEVVAIPDEQAVRLATEGMLARRAPPTPTAPPPPDLDDVRRRLDAALRRVWPQQAGGLREFRLIVSHDGAPTLEVIHFGPPLGAPGIELLRGALRAEFGVALDVRDRALPTEPAGGAPDAPGPWLSTLAAVATDVSRAGVGFLCVTVPEKPAGARKADPYADLRHDVAGVLARLAEDRTQMRLGAALSFEVAESPCPWPNAGQDAGVDGGDGGAGPQDAASDVRSRR